MAITYNPNNFSSKDDVNAVLTGVDFDVEFTAISSALALAAPVSAPSFSGTASFDVITAVGNVTVGGNLSVSGTIIEDTVVNVSHSGAYELGSGTAALVYHDLNGNTSYTDGIVEGQNITLMVKPDSFTVTWPAAVKWVGGIEPTLDTANFNIISLWKVNGILFGSWGGSVDAS